MEISDANDTLSIDTNAWRIATLTEEEAKRIREIEERLGVVLIAYNNSNQVMLDED